MSRAEFGLVPAQMAGRMGAPRDAEIERERARLEALEADRWLDHAAALDRENRALRERCERLRQAAIFADGLRQQDQALDRALAACEARGDLDPLEAEHADAG